MVYEILVEIVAAGVFQDGGMCDGVDSAIGRLKKVGYGAQIEKVRLDKRSQFSRSFKPAVLSKPSLQTHPWYEVQANICIAISERRQLVLQTEM